jgi:hypothetical protein
MVEPVYPGKTVSTVLIVLSIEIKATAIISQTGCADIPCRFTIRTAVVNFLPEYRVENTIILYPGTVAYKALF